MKKITVSYLSLLVFLISCNGKTETPPKKLYNEEFKWTIVIPENFTKIDPSDWEEMQDKGAAAIEDTYGEEVVNQSETIFAFKNTDLNYLESNYQPFDTETDGNYLESCQAVNTILYETFKAQIPGAAIDSSSSVKTISGLEFQVFNMVIDLPNDIKLRTALYSRLFGNKEFSVNLTYVDDKQGEKMLNAWTNSTFE